MNMGMMALGYGNRANANHRPRGEAHASKRPAARVRGDIEIARPSGRSGKFPPASPNGRSAAMGAAARRARVQEKKRVSSRCSGWTPDSRQMADQTSRTARALCGSLGLRPRGMFASEATRIGRNPADHFARARGYDRTRQMVEGTGARANPGSYLASATRACSRRR